jgi:hypothetical protein
MKLLFIKQCMKVMYFQRNVKLFKNFKVYYSNKFDINFEIKNLKESIIVFRGKKQSEISKESLLELIDGSLKSLVSITDRGLIKGEVLENCDEETKSLLHNLFKLLVNLEKETALEKGRHLYTTVKELRVCGVITIDTFLCNTILDFICKINNEVFFINVFTDMKEMSINLDNNTFRSMIEIATINRNFEKVVKILSYMEMNGFVVDDDIKSQIIRSNPLLSNNFLTKASDFQKENQ